MPFGTDPFNRPIFDFIQDDTTKNESGAGFAHTLWHLTDKLNLAAGFRYTKQDKSYLFYRLNVDGLTPFQPLSDPANPLNGRVGQLEGSHNDYRLNVDYQWTDDLMTYVQYSTGFKGAASRRGRTFRSRSWASVRKSSMRTRSGWKSRVFSRKLQLNGAVFYNDYKGYQATPNQCVDESGQILPLPFGTPGLCGQYLNVADANRAQAPSSKCRRTPSSAWRSTRRTATSTSSSRRRRSRRPR